MKFHSVLFAAAAVGATALTFGVSAAPVHAAEVEEVVVTGRAVDAPTARVYYADLNLGSGAGRARLERRIDFAARKLCGTVSALNHADGGEIGQCKSAVLASAKPQMKAAIAAFEGGQQLALGDTGALTLSAK